MELEAKHIIVFLLAIIPAIIWIYLFLHRHHENKWLVVITFLGGMLAAKLILVYQGYWDETINLIFFKVDPVDFRQNINNLFSSSPFFALFLSFVGVGVMEEFLKFWIMKFINYRFFKSIDDVIELAIIAALGFAFFENIVYFTKQWGQLSAGTFAAFAMFRVTIVTMVHVLCSGLLGYYFGMAFFASPMLQIEHMKRKRHPVLQFLKRVLHLKKSHVYHDEMIIIGLFSAIFLHAIYDYILSINVTLIGIPLHIPIMLLYFFGGFWYLNHLLKKKDSNLKLGLVGTEVMPKEDFIKLLDEVQELKEKMRSESEQTLTENENQNEII
ncbi:PrsW family intramembrane metalloprotease [Patescibacteria group bacterium]|nr:PrsW family intramembrane metalloprotease [Patescibacteria group bacterium]